jgi:uncharacterized membrane protein YbhN (UPF0104 family)
MSRVQVPQSLVRVTQVVVLVVLTVLLWKAADGQGAVRLLQDANPSWLALAVLVLTLQTVISAQRWRITASRIGLDLSATEALREYYLAQVVNQTLPGGIIGDAGRIVRARHRAGLLVSGQAVVFERVAGQMGLVAVLVFGLALGLLTSTGFIWPEWLSDYASTLLWVFVLVPLIVIAVLKLLSSRATAGRRFLTSFRHAVLARDVVLQQIAMSLGTALCNIAAFAICAAAIGLSMPLVVTVTLVPLILFSMLIPLSVSGWGIREGAAALVFPVFGATASQGLATSVAFGFMFLVTVLPGLFVIWLRPNAPVPSRH